MQPVDNVDTVTMSPAGRTKVQKQPRSRRSSTGKVALATVVMATSRVSIQEVATAIDSSGTVPEVVQTSQKMTAVHEKQSKRDLIESLTAIYSPASTSSIQNRFEDLVDLGTKFAQGLLGFKAEHQRDFVWTQDKMSRLIASVILQQYIPPILVQQTPMGYVIVDGKQRLSALFSFIFADGYMSFRDAYWDAEDGTYKDSRVFFDDFDSAKLSGLPRLPRLVGLDEDLKGLNGLTYKDLSRAQRFKLWHYKVNVYSMGHELDVNGLFLLFRGINAGSSNLSAHQLRATLYESGHPYLDKIRNLCSQPLFQMIRRGKLKEPKDARNDTALETFAEHILSALAIRYASRQNEDPRRAVTRTAFLNEEIKRFVDLCEDARRQYLRTISKEFSTTMDIVTDLFPIAEAFRKGQGSGIRARLFESLYCAILELLDASHAKSAAGASWIQMTMNGEIIRKAVKSYLESGKYDYHLRNTSFKYGSLRRRIDILKNLIQESIMRKKLDLEPYYGPTHQLDGSRVFRNSDSRRDDLWRSQKYKCGICHQEIFSEMLNVPNKTHLDHILPVAAGGISVESNCQLVHAMCNRHKSKKLLASAG